MDPEVLLKELESLLNEVTQQIESGDQTPMLHVQLAVLGHSRDTINDIVVRRRADLDMLRAMEINLDVVRRLRSNSAQSS